MVRKLHGTPLNAKQTIVLKCIASESGATSSAKVNIFINNNNAIHNYQPQQQVLAYGSFTLNKHTSTSS